MTLNILLYISVGLLLAVIAVLVIERIVFDKKAKVKEAPSEPGSASRVEEKAEKDGTDEKTE